MSRVAVATGAGSGIGRASAQALLGAGYRVALVGRREAALAETAARHPNALVVPADVSDPQQVDTVFDRVVTEWGRVDVLFNNAGVFPVAAAVDELPLDEWNRALAVNLTAVMLCSAAAVRVMKAQSPQGGRIINNGSISAHAPRPLSPAYTATKHAVTGLTKSIDLDGRPFGITCGQIDIGNAATDLTQSIGITEGALQANGSRLVEPKFSVQHAAKAVMLMAELPPNATVNSLTITASGMPYVGRG
ncbi:SDR family oxidoreductase [Paramicrobacterium agarici]|uniref:SDR family oxidoreductase n=1 Tax=Paramicrobacterium agarici TaxID=630514 RepID=UPI0011525009|nr:SDR family oxidoreductase [Microbacterium agarici]TQO23714.1 NADP-dependent 3-hydroxy acid dehydrogenase YdfG [Microbacterium agarici]